MFSLLKNFANRTLLTPVVSVEGQAASRAHTPPRAMARASDPLVAMGSGDEPEGDEEGLTNGCVAVDELSHVFMPVMLMARLEPLPCSVHAPLCCRRSTLSERPDRVDGGMRLKLLSLSR